MSRRIVLALVGALIVLGCLFWLSRRPEGAAGTSAAQAGTVQATQPEFEAHPAALPEPPSATAARAPQPRAPVTPEVAHAVAVEPGPGQGMSVTVSARFADEQGWPLVGIELVAPSITGSPLAVSGATGLAELVLAWEDLSIFSPQACSFLARGRGYATSGHRLWFSAPEDAHLGELLMRPGGAVRGRVLDAAGLGVGGAWVRPIRPVPADSPERGRLRTWGGDRVGLAATTESSGWFVLEGLPVMALSIDAQAAGSFHAISTPLTVLAGQTVEIPELELEPAPAGQRIAGSVRTASTRAGAALPVQGAEVRLLDEQRNSIMGQVSTDELGAFAFTVAPGRRYALQVHDLSPPGRPDVNVDAIEPGTTDIAVVFEDTRPLRVIVTGVEGRPVRRFVGSVTSEDQRGVPGGQATSEDGSPVDLKVPQSAFYVAVHAPGYESVRLGPFQSGEFEELTVGLEPTTGIAGRVLSEGQPVTGARVEAHAALDRARPGLAAGVFRVFVNPGSPAGDVTGPDGEFFLNLPRAGRFHVHAKADGFARADSGSIDFDPAQARGELTLDLVRGGSVAGRVLVGALLERGGRTLAMSRGDGHFEVAVTDADGAYSFDELSPGPWQIAEANPRELERAVTGELGRTSPQTETTWDLEVADGVRTHFDLDLADKQMSRFEGQFLVDEQAPLGWVWSIPGVRGLYNERFDPEGRFSFELERQGVLVLQLTAPRTPGAHAGLRVEFELLAGLNEWQASIETGTLELTGVQAPALEDLDWGGQIDTACTLVTQLPGGATWFASVYAAEAGQLQLIQVPAGHHGLFEGEYRLLIGAAQPQPDLEYDLAPGETQTIALD